MLDKKFLIWEIWRYVVLEKNLPLIVVCRFLEKSMCRAKLVCPSVYFNSTAALWFFSALIKWFWRAVGGTSHFSISILDEFFAFKMGLKGELAWTVVERE